jgi:hypothetical protein
VTVTLTYSSSLASVDITATGLGPADYALVERSTDQLNWTTVRGASQWPVSGAVFVNTLHDYEFTPGVVNYYRVRGIEPAPISFVGAGTAASGNNASIVPTLPAGLIDGDLMICWASIRNSGAGTVFTPPGWTLLRADGNVSMLGRRYVSGDTAPTIAFSGGVLNADTLARIEAWRNAGLDVVTTVSQLNGNVQDIDYPALSVPEDNLLIIDGVWKADDFSATPSARPGFTSGGNWVSTAGDDAGMAMWYQIQTAATALPSGTHTVTGGAAAISRAMTIALRHAAFLNEQTNSITPVITQPWLKSVARPNLNLAISPDADTSGPTWTDRSGVFAVKGRSLPVAVTDLRGGREFDLCLQTATLADGDTLQLGQMFGDTVYLQIPPGYPELATGYYVVGPVRRDNRGKDPASGSFWWYLPMREVAPPNPGVVGVTVTCADIVAHFADCNAVVSAFATCAAVLDYVAAPADIIVP